MTLAQIAALQLSACPCVPAGKEWVSAWAMILLTSELDTSIAAYFVPNEKPFAIVCAGEYDARKPLNLRLFYDAGPTLLPHQTVTAPHAM